MGVLFYKADSPIPVRNRRRLKAFLKILIEREGLALDQLSYIFCSDAYLLDINQQFLNHDTYTDIVTFPFSKSPEPIKAEIYISVERVRENAKLFATSITQETHRVMFHGALHLCGYKDKTNSQQKLMRQMEDKYLALYFHN